MTGTDTLAAQNATATQHSAIVSAVASGVQLIESGSRDGKDVTAGMTLHDGDRLLGESEDSKVQIDCWNGATQTVTPAFHHQFAAVIRLHSSDDTCAMDVLSGIGIATTGQSSTGATTGPAALNAPGAVSMLSNDTQFGLVVTTAAGTSTAQGLVFDGKAVLQKSGQACGDSFVAGSLVDTQHCKSAGISKNDYQTVASAYTDLDLSQAKSSPPAQARGALLQKWVATLQEPNDPDARVALASQQAQVGATKSLIFTYELRRAAVLAASRPDLMQTLEALAQRYNVAIPTPPPPPAPSPPALSVEGSTQQSASATVRAVTAGVQLIESGSHDGQNVTAGTTLHDGDRLVGESQDSKVQIDCPNGATHTLASSQGQFAAVIHIRPPDNACAMDVHSGVGIATVGLDDAGAITDAAVADPGDVLMKSEIGQFGLIVRTKGSSTTEGLLFDGIAGLSRSGQSCGDPAAAGSAVDAQTCESSGISDNDYRTVASTYADLDLSHADASKAAGLRATLIQRWMDTLRKPDDPDVRVALVSLEAQIGATGSSIFAYELRRAAALAQAKSRSDLTETATELSQRFNITIFPPLPDPPSGVRAE